MGMFEGKVVLVTGGASGIGAAAAHRFAEEGAAVAIADLNIDGAQSVAEAVRSTGRDAEAIRCDVTSEDDNREMVAHCVDKLGGLDAAFLNAGAMNAMAPFEELDLATFDRMVALNLRGAFLGLQAVRPVIRQGGAAVVTASAAAVLGLTVAAAYSASKHGVIGLVRSACMAFAQRGARVNAICPGSVATPLLGFMEPPQLQDPDALANPDYRGTLLPQHVAEVALFLASSRSAGINGQAQIVDAGYLAAFPPLE